MLALALFLSATILFLDLAEGIWLDRGLSWDVPIILAIRHYTSPTLTQLMIVITEFGSLFATLLYVLALIWLWRKKRRLDMLALTVNLGGAVLMSEVLKTLFGRTRPDVLPPLVIAPGYSFPSGHTITAASLYGAIALFLWAAKRRLLAIGCLVLIPLVGLSRIYLGVHFPSDVLASMALASGWLVIVAIWHYWAATRFGEIPHSPDHPSHGPTTPGAEP